MGKIRFKCGCLIDDGEATTTVTIDRFRSCLDHLDNDIAEPDEVFEA